MTGFEPVLLLMRVIVIDALLWLPAASVAVAVKTFDPTATATPVKLNAPELFEVTC